MGNNITAFYSPDDDLEHALTFDVLFPGGSGITDTSFSPSTQGHYRSLPYGCPQVQSDNVRAISGLYSPLDGLRYVLLASFENQVYISWYSENVHAPADPRLPCGGFELVYDTPFPSYPLASIADIAAFFSPDDNQIYVTVLMKNGDLWELFGTKETVGSWSAIPFLFVQTPGGQSITAYYAPQDQERHMLIATDHDITHVHFTSNSTAQEAFPHIDETILAISGFYTPDDEIQHVIVASIQTTNGGENRVSEITFQTGVQTPAIRQLGIVDFNLGGIGAYVKPDSGRHVIMQVTTSPSSLSSPGSFQGELYLSWYYPGWTGFVYGPWPPTSPWP